MIFLYLVFYPPLSLLCHQRLVFHILKGLLQVLYAPLRGFLRCTWPFRNFQRVYVGFQYQPKEDIIEI